MRRLLAVGAVIVAGLAIAPVAHAQDSGYTSAWTDPSPSATRDDKPVAYLDGPRALVGQVSHPNGIRNVSAVLVVDPQSPPPDGCSGQVDPNAELDGGGSFRVNGTFPCNLVYEIRATAQANPGSGLGATTPGPHTMPLLLAVAVPPAPVSQVDAALEVDGEDSSVTLEWPAGPEPDLLGYVVARTADGDTDMLGQVDAADRLRFVDDDPAPGTRTTYTVTAVRNGPDDDVEQVPSAPTAVTVDVPGEKASDASGSGGSDSGTASGGDDVAPQLASGQIAGQSRGRPDAGSLSSVRARGATGRPSPPTTADTGFSETIDYGEPGDQAAVLPNGDPSVVALYDESTSGSPWSNRETMSFVAGGLAVLMMAASIATVTRRAARAAY